MPRKSTHVPDVTGPQLTPLSEIPDDVKKYVEEVYDRQRKVPGRERAEYDNEAEKNAEWKLISDYCAQRPAGILAARRSPTRNKGENVMEFRITADLPANGAKNATGEKGAVKR